MASRRPTTPLSYHTFVILSNRGTCATIPPEATTKTIPLTKGKSAKVSDADYARLMRHKWSAVTGDGGNTYAVRKVTGNRHVYMHQEVLGVSGKTIVDHKNTKTLDNQRGNLRRASRSKNATTR